MRGLCSEAAVVMYSEQITRRHFLAMGSAGAAAGVMRVHGSVPVAPPLPKVSLVIASLSVEVAPGRTIHTTAYNGAIAEVLKLPAGTPVEVEIENQLSRNEYVHWHGFQLDARLDGTPEENSLAVTPSRRLRYTLPAQRAGSYYVHSHAMAHHDMNAGPYSGQFAFVHVQPERDPGNYDREVFLATHEWEPYMVNEREDERSIEEMQHLRADPEEVEGVGEGGWDIRYRIASMNGKALRHGEPVRVKQGERVLFHLLNASATENVQIAFPGHVFQVLAMDACAAPKPVMVSTVDLGVGERVDAVVEMNAPGIWVLGSADAEMREKGLGVVVEYAGCLGEPVWSDSAATEWDYTLFGNQPVQREVEEICITLTRLPLAEDGTERWAMVNSSGKKIESLELCQDRPFRMRLRNDSDEWHPMHLHRHAFELIRYRGKPTAGIFKDTVVVPPYDELELLMTPRQSGFALFHCHNQMHMDAGLEMLFTVEPQRLTHSRITGKS